MLYKLYAYTVQCFAYISRIAAPRTHIPEGIGNYTLYSNSSKSEETLKYVTLKHLTIP